MLAAVAWDGGGDGTNWSDANNWSSNAVPGAADDVTIDVPGAVTVLVRGAQPSVQSLVNRETLWLRGDNTFGNAAASISGNVTNDGTIKLESIDSTWSDTLSVGGVLSNSSTGVVQMNAGTGGQRFITGNIDNSGAISTTSAFSGGAAGKTFNQMGGSVTASGGGSFAWASGTMNFSGGAFSGAVYVNGGSLSVASTAGAQTILVEGASTLLSNDSTAATVWVQGNNMVGGATLAIPGNATNNGTIRMESIDSSWSETLNIGGVLSNSASGVIQVNAGTGGTRAINGNINNSGTINTAVAVTAGASGKTFNQIGGTVTASGTGSFVWSSGTMNFSGGSFVGSVYLNGGSLSVASTAGA